MSVFREAPNISRFFICDASRFTPCLSSHSIKSASAPEVIPTAILEPDLATNCPLKLIPCHIDPRRSKIRFDSVISSITSSRTDCNAIFLSIIVRCTDHRPGIPWFHHRIFRICTDKIDISRQKLFHWKPRYERFHSPAPVFPV